MTYPYELNAAAYVAIKNFCTEGDRLADLRCYDEAVDEYNKAWLLVPEPQSDWEASTWILVAIADACFHAGYINTAREALEYALICPDGLGNPFLHLRYGQVLYHLGELDRASEEFMRAYMGGGNEIFDTEDPKYLEHLKTRAKL
jgi:tetratricopeptide (TPR) repeat protein